MEINQDYMLVKSLQDNYKRRFFAEAIKTPAVGKRVERPEWALTKNSGKYSLQVASFFPEGGYRDVYASAVQYVEQLRKEGCEAYYYHGPSWSLVTVGSFGSEDVITQPNGQQRYSNRVESLQQKEEFKYNYENGQIRSRKLGSQTIQPKSFLIEVPRRPGEDK